MSDWAFPKGQIALFCKLLGANTVHPASEILSSLGSPRRIKITSYFDANDATLSARVAIPAILFPVLAHLSNEVSS